jgi:hypothetical protein
LFRGDVIKAKGQVTTGWRTSRIQGCRCSATVTLKESRNSPRPKQECHAHRHHNRLHGLNPYSISSRRIVSDCTDVGKKKITSMTWLSRARARVSRGEATRCEGRVRPRTVCQSIKRPLSTHWRECVAMQRRSVGFSGMGYAAHRHTSLLCDAGCAPTTWLIRALPRLP